MEEYQWSNRGHEPQFGQGLSEERKEIRHLLSRYHHATRNTPGWTDQIVHRIKTVDNSPIRLKPYRIPQAYREKVYDELEMEKNGVIEESKSERAFPLVIVTKKDGGVRLCVDYRKLNHITKFEAYPMPRIEELLDQVGNANFISTLDLAKGYWQVPMSLRVEKRLPLLPRYQFITMPFGLSGTPATFQRMMDDNSETQRYLLEFI